MKNLKAVFYCIGILLSLNSYGQKIPPLGSLPTFYNGGFAGEGGKIRLNFGTVASIGYGYRFNFYSSIDGFIPKIRTGIGFTTIQGTNGSQYSLAISPKFSHQGRYTFAPFIDYTFQNYTRYSDTNSGSVSHIGRGGILFNSRKLYLGLTLETGNYGKMYWGLYGIKLQAGYTFQRRPDSKFSFTPQIVLGNKYPGSFKTISVVDASILFRHSKVIWGVNSNGIAIGYQSNKFKVLLSQFYWITAYGATYGASVSMRYLIPGNANKP